MKTYNTFNEAQEAASEFFKTNFNHSGAVGFEYFRQNDGSHVYQFYSKDDPAMDDVFECLIDGQ